MTSARLPRRFSLGFAVLTMCLFIAISNAQQGRRGVGPDTLPDEPQISGFGDQRFRVVPIKGLFRPSALDFLPNGDILVAERSGGLRVIRDGVLDPQPIEGMPEVHAGYGGRWGLWDVAVHPQFTENQLVYFTYLKPDADDDVPPDATGAQGLSGTQVLGRGRYDGGNTLTDVEDIFVSDAQASGFSVARLVFAPDGKIFMSIGMPLRDEAHGGGNRVGTAEQAQDPASHAGKILRLNDDGTAPSDNPFVDEPGYRPEIYAMGFRDPLGMLIHPETGELWEVEHGPQGGDEVNIVRPGGNYGWSFRTGAPTRARRRQARAGRDRSWPTPAPRAWSSRSSIGTPSCRPAAWPSTPATASRSGGGASSWAGCPPRSSTASSSTTAGCPSATRS